MDISTLLGGTMLITIISIVGSCVLGLAITGGVVVPVKIHPTDPSKVELNVYGG